MTEQEVMNRLHKEELERNNKKKNNSGTQAKCECNQKRKLKFTKNSSYDRKMMEYIAYVHLE